MAADTLIFAKLQECGAVEIASSEESSEMKNLGGQGFSVRPHTLYHTPRNLLYNLVYTLLSSQ